MANNYGPGASRVLDPKQTGYKLVLWQMDRPPLDSELSLMGDLAAEWNRIHVLQGTPSGWYGDAINPQDSFSTNRNWSNWFKFGPQFSGEKGSIPYAVVNGWIIPVTGTLTGTPPGSPNNTDTWNRITLPPPPANTGDARIDFVFLEAWLARIPPNPATTNKPAASAIWRYGNVESGYSFIADDLQDPDIGFETTQRVQLQYRIRVVSGLVGLAGYPDGFDPSVVKGQGAATSATSFVFENMRQELGDPGLWRAGDGSANGLGTVDGYSYAIPICATFRRNSVAWDGSSGQNLNGGVNRNPTAVDRTGYKTFSTVPTTTTAISATATTLTLVSVSNIPLPLTPASPLAIKIGDEVMYYSAITGTTMTISSRGVYGTTAEAHPAGSVVNIFSGRPDGLFADQVTTTDILDLRHVVNPGGFDYQALLKGGLDRLMRGQLASTWKRSGGGPQGRFVAYRDVITAGSVAMGLTKLDAPDGIRQVFGDPALLQPVVIPINSAPSVGAAVSVGATLGNTYTVTANTVPGGGPTGYRVGDVITIPKSQFVGSLPGSDVDQVSIVATTGFVSIRFMGATADVNTAHYTLALNGSGDLLITFVSPFPTNTDSGAFITIHLQYGAGRGLSRLPNVVNSVAYISGSPNIALRQAGSSADNQALSTAWAPLWSKYRSGMYNNQLPATAEALVDPGSKTVILTPFRLQPYTTSLSGSRFKTIQKSSGATNGAMPANTPGGSAKWGSTDPLSLFSGYGDPTTARANMVVIAPRRLWPGWGAVHSPILYQDSGNIDQGVNFGISAPKGASPPASVSNYVPVTNGGVSYAVFSSSLPYNTAGTIIGVPTAGMQFFTDTRGLGRQGLELPPYYVFARLFAVYELADYVALGSAFNPTTREPNPSGNATNLLRQDFQGPTFWIEQDEDGDPTCILNADAIDITKSPNTISSFGAGTYVIEASIIGMDRGSFDLATDCRIVLSRARTEGLTANVTLSNPEFLLPGAPVVGDDIGISYTREPYQGDAWGSQMTQSDIGYNPGAMPTATRYQLMTTTLDYADLERPNQKVLEVLAGMAFQTTLGTGRLSGDVPAGTNVDFRSVGYEPWTVPTSSVDARPTVTPTALVASERLLSVGTEYLGTVERLPLGALFKSKDFRGNSVSVGSDQRQLVSGVWYSPATMASNVAPTNNTEYGLDPVQAPSMASGNAGETVAHVDGEQGNYSGLTIYRTARGGSAFTLSGIPGGDVAGVLPQSGNATTAGGILSGIAMLVRNTPTSVGSTEVSAGQELMLLVVTTGRAQGSSGTVNTVQCGPAGTGEGYAAADLFRLPGHPICNDSARPTVSPEDVTVARSSDLLT